MKKEEYIKKYGEAAYIKQQEQIRDWRCCHPAELLGYNREGDRKDGKYYKKRRQYRMSGIPHVKNLIRQNHLNQWRPYKQIIAPASQIHHEWIPGTADYTGVALVEKDQHLHGIIDVIQILEGEITLFTEEAIRSDIR